MQELVALNATFQRFFQNLDYFQRGKIEESRETATQSLKRTASSMIFRELTGLVKTAAQLNERCEKYF
jgi:hypothetical protein